MMKKFTLIELLVIIGLLIIIFSLFISTLMSAETTKAAEPKLVQNWAGWEKFNTPANAMYRIRTPDGWFVVSQRNSSITYVPDSKRTWLIDNVRKP